MNVDAYRPGLEPTPNEDLAMIQMIVERAKKENLLHVPRATFYIDITVIKDKYDLNITKFLNANIEDFSHDVAGIQACIDRESKILTNNFIPCCSSIIQLIPSVL